MSELSTVARPYARAIFECALAKNQLAPWSQVLHALSVIVSSPDAQAFLVNPATTLSQHQSLLIDTIPSAWVAQVDKAMLTETIALLVENKRLASLPVIAQQFDELRAAKEKTLVAHVRSFSPFSPEQEAHLIKALNQRLDRQVSLEVVIDKTLLGGAIICAGDLVIDGSIRSQLNKLSADLVA